MNYYDLLGVGPSATTEEIRHAYLVRAQLVHPDRHNGAAEALLAEAARVMVQLNDAWAVLQDPAARRTHDEQNGLSIARDPLRQNAQRAEATASTPTRLTCERCLGAPAVRVKFTALRARLIFTKEEHVVGAFCRNCGQAIGRQLTDITLMQGWWALFAWFMNLIVVACNLSELWRVARLAPPHCLGARGPDGQLDPGRPVYLRVGFALTLLLFASVVITVARRWTYTP